MTDAPGSAAEIARDDIATLGDVVSVHARAHPDRCATWYKGRSLSFADLDRLSDRIAQALQTAPGSKSARIAFLDKNGDTFFPILFGAAKAGRTLVPINFRLAPQEIAFILRDSGTSLLFAGAEYRDTLATIRTELPDLEDVVFLDDDLAADQALDDWPHAATPSPAPERKRPGPTDTAMQMYTSGTTGHPKGVELSHQAMVLAAIEGLSVWPAMFRDGAAVLATMPLFHIAGCNLGLASLFAGGRVDILRGGTPREIVAHLADRKIAIVPLPAALIHEMIKLPDIASFDLSHLDTLLIAGSGIQVDLLREAQETLKCGFALSYGMTECCGGLTYLGPRDCTHDAGEKLKSAGLPLGGSKIRVVDAEGQDCPPRITGEILCQSGRVMTGYWNRPEATREALAGDWYHSGDAGYLDEAGYLYVVDRIKDMIVSGGENIYPVEVETQLIAHPAVDDVAVIGVPDPKWGESLLACIILKPGSPEPDDFETFLRPRLAGYKIPRRYRFLTEFPRNATGKVLKRELRKTFADAATNP